MKIAVLSGKGGTGKTFISVNLAAVAEHSVYIDCDVEEPNGHLFLEPHLELKQPITVLVPHVDPDMCCGCADCVKFCRFNALAYAVDELMIFEKLCHSCGGCVLVCPHNALTEKERTIGYLHIGSSENVAVYSGFLNPGEESGVPIIKQLLRKASKGLEFQEVRVPELTVIDCPPGSSCAVMESMQDADYCLLVGEPTAFGVHNLKMVRELVELYKKPYGVVLNKYLSGGNDPTEEYCKQNGLNILNRIPFDFQLGKALSDGEIPARTSANYYGLFRDLLGTVKKEVRLSYEEAANS